MKMNLRHMEVFRAVMNEGSITAAAVALGVSQPSVSEIIKHAENRSGLQLFLREKGRLHPTAYAHRLRSEIEVVFHQVAKVNRLVDELNSEQEVSLTLGCICSLSLSLVPRLISRLHTAEPRLLPRVLVEGSEDIARKVSSGLVDASLIFLSERHSDIENIVLREAPLRFVCQQDHHLAGRNSVSVEDLAGEVFVSYLQKLPLQRHIEAAFRNAGASYQSGIQVEQIVQAWALVQAEQGVAIADPFSQLDMFFPGMASIVIRDIPPVPLELLVKKGRALSPALGKLATIIKSDFSLTGIARSP